MSPDMIDALSRRVSECSGFKLELRLMELSSLVLALQRARTAKDNKAVASALIRLSRFGRALALTASVELFAEYSIGIRQFAGDEMSRLNEVEMFYERWLPSRIGAYYQPEREELDRLLRARAASA